MLERPPLSVILATIEPWPDLANCLEVLLPQLAAIGGELIVGDGDGGALDQRTLVQFPWLSVIRIPGASVFELRARALEQARGEIVATTEDHCLVAAHWCESILQAFARNPAADAVTGPVLNGSRDALIDWANYLHNFGSTLPPFDAPERWYRAPTCANVAYRSSVLPTQPVAAGWLELELNPRLFHEGRFARHAAMTVTHVQSHGFWGTLAAHFHNGRTTTGLHAVRFSRNQFPWMRFRSTVRGFSDSPDYRSIIRKALPFVFLLSCAHALGETVGILAGPGQSPARLR